MLVYQRVEHVPTFTKQSHKNVGVSLRDRLDIEHITAYLCLVGGWPTPLKNDGVRQWEGWHPIYEMENKSHVPNHQPVFTNDFHDFAINKDYIYIY